MLIEKMSLLEDLKKIEGKAEIVDGRIVLMPPTGIGPNHAAFAVAFSLEAYVRQTGKGMAISDGAGFITDLPHRESFCPDAAYMAERYSGMGFFPKAPTFAVEVRSEGDYGPRAERAIAEKREDYFASGTLVVWDVDILGTDVVRAYHASDPSNPIIFRRGDRAHAEPALPGWSMAVDELFLS